MKIVKKWKSWKIKIVKNQNREKSKSGETKIFSNENIEKSKSQKIWKDEKNVFLKM